MRNPIQAPKLRSYWRRRSRPSPLRNIARAAPWSWRTTQSHTSRRHRSHDRHRTTGGKQGPNRRPRTGNHPLTCPHNGWSLRSIRSIEPVSRSWWKELGFGLTFCGIQCCSFGGEYWVFWNFKNLSVNCEIPNYRYFSPISLFRFYSFFSFVCYLLCPLSNCF